MANRYSKYKVFNNDSDYYDFLRKSRNNSKNIRHYQTPRMHMPSMAERSRVKTNAHTWKYGDRFYKLANQYYNDSRYWWVIAWYNAYMTEADVFPGDIIHIPLNLEQALRVLKAY